MIVETPRLRLRTLVSDDAAFVLELVNEPSFLANIGDKGVRSEEDARNYIRNVYAEMYQRLGYGFWGLELKTSGELIGICGLTKRDTLDDVDLGFALLEKHWRKGYAREAAEATLEYGERELGLARIIAITSPLNDASCTLLEKLGFHLEGLVDWEEDETRLYGWARGGGGSPSNRIDSVTGL